MMKPAEITSLPLAAPPDIAVKIELDDRAFLFPDGKSVTHLLVVNDRKGGVHLEAVFAFNKTHRNPRFASFNLRQLREFTREFLGAVYAAKTSFVLDETLKITISVITNGYHIEFMRAEERAELFLGTACIWRVLKGLMAAADDLSPVVAN